jgi:hypothetical protein
MIVAALAVSACSDPSPAPKADAEAAASQGGPGNEMTPCVTTAAQLKPALLDGDADEIVSIASSASSYCHDAALAYAVKAKAEKSKAQRRHIAALGRATETQSKGLAMVAAGARARSKSQIMLGMRLYSRGSVAWKDAGLKLIDDIGGSRG